MDEEVEHIIIPCLYLNITYVMTWIFKFGVHMPILHVVKVYRPDDECLS